MEFIQREEESALRTSGLLPMASWLADRAMAQLVPTRIVGERSRLALILAICIRLSTGRNPAQFRYAKWTPEQTRALSEFIQKEKDASESSIGVKGLVRRTLAQLPTETAGSRTRDALRMKIIRIHQQGVMKGLNKRSKVLAVILVTLFSSTCWPMAIQ